MRRRSSDDGLAPAEAADSPVCPLCERPIPDSETSRHHLVPKLKGGARGPTAILHRVCHGKIHSVLSEAELARSYATIAALREHAGIAKFIRWVSKRPPDYRSSNRRSKHRR